MKYSTKNLSLKLATCLASTAMFSPVFAQSNTEAQNEPRYYGSIQVGRNNVTSWKNEVNLGGGVQLPGLVSSDAKGVVGLVLGRQETRVDNNEQKITRYELEYQRGQFNLTGVEVGVVNAAVSGKGKYEALTLNAVRQVPWNESWSGYAGLGIGWGRVQMPQFTLSNACNCTGSPNKSGLTVLARGGVEYSLDNQNKAFVQYTFLNLKGPDSDGTPSRNYSRKWVGALSVGYRYIF